jgi:hypothetical protein
MSFAQVSFAQKAMRKCRCASVVRKCRCASVVAQMSLRKCRCANVVAQMVLRKCHGAGFSSSRQVNNQTSQIEKFKEVEVYGDSFNILEFWGQNTQQYPVLSELAKKFLSIPATSASVERVFSQIGILDTKLRNRLNIDRLNSIVLAKHWLKQENPELFERVTIFDA